MTNNPPIDALEHHINILRDKSYYDGAKAGWNSGLTENKCFTQFEHINPSISDYKAALTAIQSLPTGAALQPAPIDIEELKREAPDFFWANSEKPIEARIPLFIDYLASRGLITQKVAEIDGLGAVLAKANRYEDSPYTVLISVDDSNIMLKASRKYHELTQQGEVK